MKATRQRSLYCLVLFVLVSAALFLFTNNYSSSLQLESWTILGRNSSRHPDTPHLPSSSPHSSNAIQQLWQESWAAAYVAAQPVGRRIELLSAYGNHADGSSDDSPRKPGRNLVKNSDADLEGFRLAHAKFVSSMATMSDGRGMFKGRGVVTVGGGEYFGPAIVGIHMLRKTGSSLPVEVFVANEAEYESTICDKYLPLLNAKCLIIDSILNSANTSTPKVKHYQLKSFAILFSSFTEVLYIDSDSIPLVDPSTELFASKAYTLNGFICWPDFWMASESPSFYNVAGLATFPSNLPRTSSESGQLLINKDQHIKTLLLAVYYNMYGPDLYYPLLSQGALGQGDKETFLAAATILGKPFYRVKTPVKSVNRNKGGIKISGMVQHLPMDNSSVSLQQPQQGQPRPAFLHANTPKMNAGHLVDEGDLEAGSTRLRLWGSQQEQIRMFGHDLERSVWEVLIKTGCELSGSMKDWKHRKRLCERLKEHWEGVFASGL